MIFSLRGLLGRAVRKSKIEKQVTAAMACSFFIEVVGSIFGPEIKTKVKPLALKNGSLEVSVLNSVVVSELRLRQTQIIKGVNKKLGRPAVKGLRFLF